MSRRNQKAVIKNRLSREVAELAKLPAAELDAVSTVPNLYAPGGPFYGQFPGEEKPVKAKAKAKPKAKAKSKRKVTKAAARRAVKAVIAKR